MRITISLNEEQLALLNKLMADDHQTNRSTYFVYLLAQEEKNRTKRPAGRPKKEEDVDELPDENEPRTLKNPYPEFVLAKDRNKLVNRYDIVMLEERKRLHDIQNEKV